LRAVYEDYYRRITARCVPGRTLEIGGGSGNLKEHLGDVISTDIVPSPWLDVAADAQALPFTAESFSNIVGVDVLHHIERPQLFFEEADRVLRPGGRIIFMEPAITFLSQVFYRYFHAEPVDMHAELFADGPKDPKRAPFDANQAIPTLLFVRRNELLNQRFPSLKLIATEHLSLFVYPLSGGFRPWCLVPTALVAPVLRVEDALAPFVGKWLSFRLLAIMEKQSTTRIAQSAEAI
jgi:SAM-dependent methyltransferase